ncbi:helix-turn-helix domain-containing protein [Kitasatospora sp. NBC_01302]|uniref:helix-turn-helix domain-containing protein n=1 Tax=Kitasatospora sp. NBC_01302 TaxID=2903575 RepID=UPI002E0FAC92|nr:helix-turn-helix domain-containing protein [Kitasatospora sp. NBC_01302]
MPSTVLLGYRIASARAMTGLTRSQVSQVSGVSVSMLRKIEGGERAPSDALLDALAEALGTTADELLGGPGRTDSRVHRMIPDLRGTLASYDSPDDGPVRPIEQLAITVDEMTEHRVNSRYGQLIELAPALLGELFRAIDQAAGVERRRAARLAVLALRSADAVAYKYGYVDLSARLIELMRWAAGITEDAVLDAVAAYVRTEVFFASNRLSAGLKALQGAVDRVSTPGTVALSAAAAALHMRAAVVAGRMRDAGQAREHLASAELLARQLPEQLYDGTAIGPDSLQIHRLSVAVELNDSADLSHAVSEASRWAPPRDLPAERRSHYYIDLGRAQVQLGQREHALESLQVARRIAPQHVREHGQVRSELATLLRLSRGRNEELRAFCQWAHAA